MAVLNKKQGSYNSRQEPLGVTSADCSVVVLLPTHNRSDIGNLKGREENTHLTASSDLVLGSNKYFINALIAACLLGK